MIFQLIWKGYVGEYFQNYNDKLKLRHKSISCMSQIEDLSFDTSNEVLSKGPNQLSNHLFLTHMIF